MGLLDNQSQDAGAITIKPSSYATHQPSPQQQDFFKFRISSEDLLDELEHKLRGEMFDYSKKVWMPKFAAWVNEDGISAIISIVYSYANKNTFMAFLKEEQILFKCKSLQKKLAQLFFLKGKVFNIDNQKRSILLKMIVDTIHCALSRCEDGREAEQISVQTQRHEISHEEVGRDDKSSLNPLNWLKRGGG